VIYRSIETIAEIAWPDTPFDLRTSLLLAARRGSESCGTFIPSSDPNSIDDRDIMGVCVPPAPWALGLRNWEGAESIKGVWDVVLYDFRKFVRLVCKQNPNVVGMLWLVPEDYLYRSLAADRLIEARDAFRARQPAYDSFIGYAHSQLKKMSSGAYRGYMGEKRKRLVDKHGFDRKNAAHLIRLLHMGEEYQRTGKLHVRRTWDQEMLIEIKSGNGGNWSLANVQSYAEDCFGKMRAALRESALPETVNEEVVEELVVSIMRERIRQS
jgi:predicted nucleotidyltransferase